MILPLKARFIARHSGAIYGARKIMSAQTNRRGRPCACPRGMGFSIIELLVVVVVIAVLAAIAFPKYNKAVDETHRREAKTILNIIRSAQQAYKIDNGSYYGFDSLDESDEANDVRSVLNIDIYDNDDWEYSVGVSGSDSSTATATATRKRGEHADDKVLLDVTGGVFTVY